MQNLFTQVIYNRIDDLIKIMRKDNPYLSDEKVRSALLSFAIYWVGISLQYNALFLIDEEEQCVKNTMQLLNQMRVTLDVSALLKLAVEIQRITKTAIVP